MLRPLRAAQSPQFHPHYPQQLPSNPTLAHVKAGTDAFVTEKYHDQIAEILANWASGLLTSPANVESIQTVLANDFSGASLLPSESRTVRSGSSLAVYKEAFSQQVMLAHDAFLKDVRSSLGVFTHIYTAEFQVTRIEGTPERLHTQVRFDLVGDGQGFHREQRSGHWEIDWRDYKLQKWIATEQTRSRAITPCYLDISQHAFASATSYSTHLSHGIDYWRTVLDGACGIDIYGHNGVSVGDIDGDGFDDLYVCQPAGLPNRLFRNRGDGTFEDITDASGLGLLDNTACAIFADFDNDGQQDLIVVRATGPLLFLNQGGGKFKLKPDAFRFANPPRGTFTGAAAADYNRDGLLDIYFCLYTFYQGADQYNYPTPYFDAENGPPNFLMRNNGDGTFRDVTAESGLNQNNTRFSFCCGWGDSNGDGWPDLYVVNDFGRKNLYRNNGNGTFSDVAAEAGVEDVGAGMSVSWLASDLYVANMWTAAGLRISSYDGFAKDSSDQVRGLYRKHAMGNSLFRNKGLGTFEDVTVSAGVGIGRWSWSSDTFDFDHDGHPDLYIANGMLSGPDRQDLNSFFWRQVVANSPDKAKRSALYEQGWTAINELIRSDATWSGYERNVFYANNGDGTFSDVSGAVGLNFLEDGRSFAVADFNHDGRQEVFVKNRNAPQLRLLQNVMPALPPSIAFHLKGGEKSNRDAIGAAITIQNQTKFLQAGSGFLSQHSKELFFGLGNATRPIMVTVRWPSGLVQQFKDLPPNQRIWLEELLPAPTRTEPFRPRTEIPTPLPEPTESLPLNVETWLISPIAVPDFHKFSDGSGRPVVLNFSASHWTSKNLQVVTLGESDELTAVYNIVYRHLFDRHRDLTLPTSFLINSAGNIVKVYQGSINQANVERDSRETDTTSKALPFSGVATTYEFGRNYLSLGTAFYQRGLFEQAQLSFARAAHDDPDSAEAHYGLGSAYLKQEKISEARTHFQIAVKLKAAYPDTTSNAWNNLGLLSTREGQLDAAIGYFKSALTDNPDYSIALLNLGNAYRQQKNWNNARQVLERALAINPEEPEANYSLAMVFAQTDDSDKAYDYLQRALKYRAAYPEALNNLGVLYLRTRRRNEAVETFEECIRVAPDFNQSYLNLARVYALEGETTKARALLTELLKRHPADAQAQRALEQLP